MITWSATRKTDIFSKTTQNKAQRYSRGPIKSQSINYQRTCYPHKPPSSLVFFFTGRWSNQDPKIADVSHQAHRRRAHSAAAVVRERERDRERERLVFSTTAGARGWKHRLCRTYGLSDTFECAGEILRISNCSSSSSTGINGASILFHCWKLVRPFRSLLFQNEIFLLFIYCKIANKAGKWNFWFKSKLIELRRDGDEALRCQLYRLVYINTRSIANNSREEAIDRAYGRANAATILLRGACSRESVRASERTLCVCGMSYTPYSIEAILAQPLLPSDGSSKRRAPARGKYKQTRIITGEWTLMNLLLQHPICCDVFWITRAFTLALFFYLF